MPSVSATGSPRSSSPLAHRATGKSIAGFLHRGRQLRDFVAVYRDRRRGGSAASD